MAELCEQHNLVLANDGKCVLCRRAQRRYFDLEPRPPTASDRLVTVVLGVGLLGALGALLWAVQLPPPDPTPRYATRAEHNHDLGQAPGQDGTREGGAGAAQLDEEPPITSALTADDGLSRSAAAADRDRLQMAKPAAGERHKKLALRAAKRAVEDEKHSVPITMYSTSWCTICETSRYYLLGRELKFSEHDIERDAAAAKRMARLNPARSVPTFVIDGQVLVGFNAWQLEGALETAAQKQLAQRPGVACAQEQPCTAEASARR